MTTANLYTFISLFKETADADAQTALSKIEIPRIQRDYAQGRNLPEVKRIRNRFLNSLYDALTSNQPIKLDFVYGDIKDDKLIPLDGQQRLTTLFLLHWYVAKHENIDAARTKCLQSFTYETRRSAREFCECLGDHTPDFAKEKLSDDITDQAWMPLDWKNDPTINSMLNMLDDIHLKFRSTSGLWECLEQGVISFYFLPLEDMGLTDELYIKMNSRGKPLTEFEHFKAEWERAISKLDKDAADRISHKIDIDWTDMLWPYKGDNNIIDDEFVRYFTYVCALIYYKQFPEEEIPSDIFDLVQDLFANKPNANANLAFIEQCFDCWVGENIPMLFSTYLTNNEHEDGKASMERMVDVFADCCNNYGGKRSERVRSFPVGRMILLYAFILFLQNKDSVQQHFPRRLRILTNLIKNSEYELREDRMNALLTQTEEIILKGEVNVQSKSFNEFQVKEEQEKQQWLLEHEEDAARLFELEDHPLLYGSIGILGLDHLDYADRFCSLFECDRGLVNRALLTIGDYSMKVNWRYQIGSQRNDSTWKALFHRSRFDDLSVRRSILLQLLDTTDVFTDDILTNIIDQYLATAKVFDWRYYLVKYDTMRLETFGMYYWYDYQTREKQSYRILMMLTEKSIGGRNYNIFLQTLFEMSKSKNLQLGEYAYAGDGDALTVEDKGIRIKSMDSAYEVCSVATNELLTTVDVPQENGIDTVDRIELGLRFLEDCDIKQYLANAH